MPNCESLPVTAADTAAMAFTHPSDLATAAEKASRFAGPGGRMATIPDIVDARMASAPGSPAWELGYTTSSAEYVGHSAGGVPLIVVAHGLGPLTDPEGSPEVFIQKATGGGEWRMSPEAFRAMTDGFYGPVAIIELRSILRSRKFALMEMLTYDQTCDDPLVRARLGIRCQEFLDRQRELSRSWLRNKYRDTFRNECVMSQRDARRSPYACTDVETPMAHPLAISPLLEYRHGHWDGPDGEHESLVTEIACHERTDEVRIVGIRGQVRLTEIR